MRLTANSTSIPNNGNSSIIAALLQDNNGNTVTGYLSNGTPIYFTTTLGTIVSPINLINSVAQSTLKSGLIAGIATVSATLDGHTIYTSVKIKDTIPPKVAVNPLSGLYNNTKTVTLKISETGTIYYTLNGNNPTLTSTKYKGSINISKTTILKYLAVDLAGNKSPVYTQKYTIDKIPPKVSLTYPKNNATGFSKTAPIAVKFSENIKISNYFNKITIKNMSTGKNISISKSIKGTKLSISTTKKTANTWYIVTIPKAAIKDFANNNLAANYTFKFKTGT